MSKFFSLISYEQFFYFFAPLYILLERTRPRTRALFARPEILQDCAYFFFDRYLIPISLSYFRFWIILMIAPRIWHAGLTFVFPPIARYLPLNIENKILLGLVILFSRDFLLYIIHFLFHRISLLWNFHMLHHSPRNLDWLSGFRADYFEGVVIDSFAALPLALFKVTPVGIVFLTMWETNFQFFSHANVKYDLGPLAGWINDNRAHWWHHSVERKFKYGQNFGGYFLIWDKIFGTCYFEKNVPSQLGLNQDTPYPTDFIKRLLFPYRRLLSSLNSLISYNSRNERTLARNNT